jgi:N6-adenosine-specific RNA methylase IME4
VSDLEFDDPAVAPAGAGVDQGFLPPSSSPLVTPASIPLPEGPFACILADPAWRFAVRSPKGNGRSAVRHYQTMSLEEIKALSVGAVAAKNAWLFLWTTGPHLRQAFDVIDAWGFRYSGLGFTWAKTRKGETPLFLDASSWHMGTGYTTRKNVELCLLARRGAPERKARDVRELLIAARREHSRKPDEIYDRIERFCDGPRLEMFARQTRPGWSVWGNETTKFRC